MFELIIFDLGGVIVDFNEEMYIRYISKKLHLNYSKMHEVFVRNLKQHELGKIGFVPFKEKCLAELRVDPNTDIEWNSAFLKLAKTNKDVESLVRRLHKRYKTALITNISKSRYAMAYRHKFDPSIFDRRFTSFGMGIAKPSASIYRKVLESMKSTSDKTVFIDNLKKNVLGAESIGINGIVFKDYSQLVDDLERIGVL